MRRSVFSRLLIACLLPLIIIFSMVIATINQIVYDQNITFADEKAKSFADETTRQINDNLANVQGLLELLNSNLLSVDPAAPNAEETASNLAKSTLMATPYAYSVWFSFEPDGFIQGERFSRDYVKADGQITELADLDNELLANPDLAPWYVIPFETGETHFESADFYDYGLGLGSQYTDTLSTPLIRNGKIIGVVGIDTLYKDAFQFIDEKQIKNEQMILLLTEDGIIVYATDENYIKKSILDLPVENPSLLLQYLVMNDTFWLEGNSPFLDTPSRMYFNPVYTELASNQLYLYIDLPTETLFSSAESAAQTIIATSIMGLLLLSLTLFFTTRNIVKPIKKLTKSANMIAEGNLDVDLHSELKEVDESKQSKNEIANLFVSLNKMLNQLNQVQELKLEAMEATYEKEKATAAARSKSDFLAKMSHEIRTPMNAIIGMTELALREDIPIAAYEHILSIKQAGANLLSIINDILDFSKIETGKLEIVLENYLFSSMINDVINIIRMRVMDTHIRFIVNIDCNIPNALIGDEVRIRQILLNLLSNAVKYTDEGFVSLTAVGEIDDDNFVLLTIKVSDSGRGVKEEDLSKLFNDFVQIDLDKNKGIEGTGLGLAITKNFITAMNGDISVNSQYGKGSTFTVTLPQKFDKFEKLAFVENADEKSVLIYERRKLYADSIVNTLENLGVTCTPVSTDSEFYEKMEHNSYTFVFVSSFLLQNAKRVITQLGSESKLVLLTEFGKVVSEQNLCILSMPIYSISVANILNGISDSFTYNTSKESSIRFIAPDANILIVDDINTNLKVAEGLMLPYHMHMELCKSGMEAIEAVKAKHYDMVLMDHMMPDMDGIEATSHIRRLGDADPYYKNIPIIALTANAVSGTKEMFLNSGFQDFISKPIDTVKLNTILEKWIPKEKQQTSIERKNGTISHNIEIDGLDVTKGIAMTGGTLDNYLKTLAVFHKDVLEKIEEIKSCLETDHLPLYVIHVHALKSASASIGATQLSETAKTLEIAGKQEDLTFIKAHNNTFLLDLEVLLKNIDHVLSANKENAPNNSLNLKMLHAELDKLKSALEAFDSVGIDDAVSHLQEFTTMTDVGLLVKNILENTLIGEYDEAVLLIDSISL